jgi:hypothetical protein
MRGTALAGWGSPKGTASDGVTQLGLVTFSRTIPLMHLGALREPVHRQSQPTLGDHDIRTTTKERSRTHDRTG